MCAWCCVARSPSNHWPPPSMGGSHRSGRRSDWSGGAPYVFFAARQPSGSFENGFNPQSSDIPDHAEPYPKTIARVAQIQSLGSFNSSIKREVALAEVNPINVAMLRARLESLPSLSIIAWFCPCASLPACSCRQADWCWTVLSRPMSAVKADGTLRMPISR